MNDIYSASEKNRQIAKIYSSILNHGSNIKSIEDCINHTRDTGNEAGYYTYLFPSKRLKKSILFFPNITLGDKDGELNFGRELPKWIDKKNRYLCPISAHTHPYLDEPPIEPFWGPSVYDLEGTVHEIKRLQEVRKLGEAEKFKLIRKQKLLLKGTVSELEGRISLDALPLPVDMIVTYTPKLIKVRLYQLSANTILPEVLPETDHDKENLIYELIDNENMIYKDLNFPDEWNQRKIDEVAEFFAQRSL
jgi:hypothetical protein